jgi:hypothetical protein
MAQAVAGSGLQGRISIEPGGADRDTKRGVSGAGA